MPQWKRVLAGLAAMLVGSANCGHSCGGSKNDDYVLHDPCTGLVQDGAPCAGVAGTICEQKVHPNPACNAWEVCTVERTWKKRPPEKTDCATACPEAPTVAPVRAGTGALCEYAGETCGPAIKSTPPGAWQCVKTKAQVGALTDCPAVRPALGSAGCRNGTVCDYGLCQIADGASVRCEEGTWVLMGAAFLAGGIVDRPRCE